MKKNLTFLSLFLVLVIAIACLVGCQPQQTENEKLYEEYKSYIKKEMKGSFEFFWDNTVIREGSPAYGLIDDRYPTGGFGSIASVGFGLTAYVIGSEEGYVYREEAEERALKTLQTFATLQSNPESAHEGFFYHFLSMGDGTRYNNCEISTIDTAILLCGALTAGEYFGGQVMELATQIYNNVNWNYYVISRNGKQYVSMGYQDGKLLQSAWDWYAEQLMIYVLGAGSPNEEYRLDDTTYYDFTRQWGSWEGDRFIHSYFGSIFTYQFSHSWIDFRNYTDKEGVNWYQNSVDASIAARQYIIDNQSKSQTYSENSWGLTACDVKGGYYGNLGVTPRGWSPDADYEKYKGTVAPAGAIGSVVFTPEYSLQALKHYSEIPQLNEGRYGLYDAYNLDQNWYADSYVGIDKGITLLMLSNFKNECTWNYFMQSDFVTNGLEVLGFTKNA